MGRGSKWHSLANKAKAFLSFKSLIKKSKSQKTNGIPIPDDADVQYNIAKALEEKEEVVETMAEGRPSSPSSTSSASKALDAQETCPEESAAVKIQAAFRGSAARKKVRAMKSMRRLRWMLHGKAAKRQTSHAMRCIQSFGKMQSKVRFQRARLTEIRSQRKDEQHHHDDKAEDEQVGDWDDSIFSKDQIREKMQSRHAAAAKRERTLAYAFSHQLWRSYPRDLSPKSSSSDEDEKPVWSWSWIEQWMSSRSWESLDDSSTPKPPGNCHSPARFPASPGRSKQQLPVPRKNTAADIPGSPNAKTRRRLSPPSMASPSRMQAMASSAKVHNDSGEAVVKSPARTTRVGILAKVGDGDGDGDVGASSSPKTKRNSRIVTARTNGSIPGRSPRLVPVKAA